MIKQGDVEYGLEAVFNCHEESFIEIRRADTKERFKDFNFFQYAVDVMGFSWDDIGNIEHEFRLSQLTPEQRVDEEKAHLYLERMERALAREKEENQEPPIPLESKAYRAMFAEKVPSEKTTRLMNWWGWLHDIGEGKTELMFEQWLAEKEKDNHDKGTSGDTKKVAKTR
ncbi:MAG: hypothetical protein Q6370_009425 [Candidatus Sigynarchaeota archaeon]